MKITKQGILDLRRKISLINNFSIEEIEVDFEITPEDVKFYKYTGLNTFNVLEDIIAGGQK